MKVLIFFCLNLFDGAKCSSYHWCLKEYVLKMNEFNYFFGVKIAILSLRHGDNLRATLQSPKISASQPQSITRETVITLEELRDDDYFSLFWKEVLTECV